VFVMSMAPTIINPYLTGPNFDNATGLSLSVSGSIQASQFVSTVLTGNSPLVVSSTTLVPNLYVSRSQTSDTASSLSSGATGYSLTLAGSLNILSTISATNPTTGALVVAGGIATNSNIYIGSNLDPNLTTTTGALIVTGGILIQSSTDATNSTTGALVVLGGAGFGRDVFAASFNTPSDISLKLNIIRLDPSESLNIVNKIEGYSYDWSPDYIGHSNKKQFGLIAQQLEEIGLTNIVTSGPAKSVNYIALIPLLIESIKELHRQINEIKNKK